jgi:hypothetical protein
MHLGVFYESILSTNINLKPISFILLLSNSFCMKIL